MLKITTGNVTTKIIGFIPDDVQNEISSLLSYRNPNAYFIPSVKKKKWDGVMRLYNKNSQSFLTGLLSLVRSVLDDNNLTYQIVDIRTQPPINLPNLRFIEPDDFEKRPYQEATINLSEKRTRGIIKMATGAGKTLTVVEIIARLKIAPFIFYVLTKDLMNQAHKAMSKTLSVPIGKIGGGICEIKDINVCTIQTAISAMHADDKEFKISDYRFDDEDIWDEEEIKDYNKAQAICNLVKSCRGLYVDECVTGDTMVYTEMGIVRIDEIEAKNCKFVLSYDGNIPVYEKINKFWYKGNKHVYTIYMNDGGFIKCTHNHLIFTKHGWKMTEELTSVDMVLGRTGWKTIKSIELENTSEKVYDIEVNNTHCFFANDILVHNCHHVASKTVQEVAKASQAAYYRFGGSATPYRDDNADIIIQGVFGKKIVDISASYLIDRGYLIHPYILFVTIEHSLKYESWASIEKNCITANKEFNTNIANLANHLIAQDLSTLILVKYYNHGEMLKSMIPGVVFMRGDMNDKKREQAIQDLKDKKTKCLIATTLADEGLDVPTLDCVIMAGGGASSTRIMQRVGRTLRRDTKSANPREKSIVVCFEHDAKYLKKHAKKARKILETEPSFHLIQSNGFSHLTNEIDHIMGTGDEVSTLMNV